MKLPAIVGILAGSGLALLAWSQAWFAVTLVEGAIAEATGVAGAEPTAELVASVVATAWPAVAVAGGALVALAGLLVVVTGRSWPTSRRYGAGARLAADGSRPAAASDRAVDDWDGLSRGDDPTDEPDEPRDGTR